MFLLTIKKIENVLIDNETNLNFVVINVVMKKSLNDIINFFLIV